MRFGLDNHARTFGKAVSLFSILILTLFLTGCSDDYIIINSNPYDSAVFGELVGRNIGETNIISKDVYYNVINLTCGHSLNINCSNSELIIIEPGYYRIGSQFAFNDGANTEFHLALGINENRNEHCHTQRKLGTGGDVGSASFTCIDYLNTSDALTIMIENVINTNNPSIQSINLNLVKIGETS